jgi:uncharacterized protein YidB (DUF937 family)
MAEGMPSLLALLGLAAVAGYQNRDKLREMIGDAQPGRTERPANQTGQTGAVGSGGLMEEIGQIFGSGDAGRNVSEGLRGLVDRFRSAGQGAKADSWVSSEANQELQPDEVETAIGRDTIDELAQKTGLSRAEIVKRLSVALPETVDRLTPGGRLPSETEAQDLV